MFASLKGKGRKSFGMKEQVEEIERGGEFWGVLKDLYEFFKFNLCYYNILKIKYILIICFNLTFSKNTFFEKI